METNMFANCKTIEELHKEYDMKKRACEKIEWFKVIQRDYGEKYQELIKDRCEAES